MSDRFGYGEIGLGIESGENDKQTTNADRIRSSTDEELAKLMEYCGCCPPLACPHNEVGVYVTPQDCETCWLEWFKSPAEVSG